MGERTRDTSGRYQSNVTDDDVVAAVRAHDPAATSEVADAVDVTRQAVDRRLRRLRDDGRVSSKKIGASLVWFMPRSRETDETPAHGDAETFDTEGDASTTLADDTGARAGESDVSTADLKGRLRAYLDERDGGPTKSYARGILADAVVYLREHGDASTTELKTELYPRYDDHYGGERTMWESTGGRYLEDVPGVDKIGTGEWSYAGDDVVRDVLENDDHD
jgi:DNA-binding Lrp family transcriptional regulator